MLIGNPVETTIYVRAGGSSCVERKVNHVWPLPADISQRLLDTSLNWIWESHLLRDINLPRSSLLQHRQLTELNAQSAGALLADVTEIIDDEHRFIVLIGYRLDGPLDFQNELERFCGASESRIAYVVVHDGDSACLYLHYCGKLADHQTAFHGWFGVALKDGLAFPERPYAKLGIITLENIYKLDGGKRTGSK